MKKGNDEKKISRGVKNPILNFIIKLVESGALKAMSGSTCKVLDVLVAHRNPKSGTCWPSVKTIENESGVGRRQIFRAVSWLIASGIVERKKGSQELSFVNVYRVILNPIISIPPGLKRHRKNQKGCQESTKEVEKRKIKKKAKNDTGVTPFLCDMGDTNLLSDKRAPQKDMKYIGSINREKKISHKEHKENKKEAIDNLISQLVKKMSSPCGEKEFEAFRKKIQKN